MSDEDFWDDEPDTMLGVDLDDEDELDACCRACDFGFCSLGYDQPNGPRPINLRLL